MTSGRYAYGRRPALYSRRSMRSALLMAAALDPLGAPPAVCNDYVSAVKVPWEMFGNDSLADCVAADSAHTLMLRTANVSQILVPTEQEVIGLYSAVGGYVPGESDTDNGCDEITMCDYLHTKGFLGHKAAATGNIDPSNLNHVKWCNQLSGHIRLGLNLPGYAEDQFGASPTPVWDISTTGDQTVNGHDVPMVHYDINYAYVVSWGALVRMTWRALLAWGEEAHFEAFPDWIRAQGTAPSGFDLASLVSKLQECAT